MEIVGQFFLGNKQQVSEIQGITKSCTEEVYKEVDCFLPKVQKRPCRPLQQCMVVVISFADPLSFPCSWRADGNESIFSCRSPSIQITF
jgi:hypothetical protein